jgi:hypothetical protein
MKSATLRQLPVLLERLSGQTTDAARLPFRVRVGVTGHRALENADSVADRARRVLDTIETQVLRRSAATPVVFTVVSALAEGADRLVAHVVLEREGSQLEATLPLDREEFAKDFETDASRAEFSELLGRASLVYEPERAEARPQAYATGGFRLVDRIDVLIAVWDHEPPRGVGGTAAVVAYAADQKVPTFVVSAADAHRLDLPALPVETRPRLAHRLLDALDLPRGKRHESSRLELLREEFDQLDTFNHEPLTGHRLERKAAEERSYFDGAPERAGYGPSFASWSLPCFVRADVFAAFYQWVYTGLAFLVFMLAGLAVTIAAAQEIYFPSTHRLILSEVALMAALAVCVALAHKWHPHKRWISYRSLAENLRSAPFIAVIDPETRAGLDVDPLAPWFQRAFSEVWALRPRDPGHDADEGSVLRDFFNGAWIGGQIRFHNNRSDEFDRYHHGLTLMINVLFLGTFVAALLDAVEVANNHALVFLAISLPAFGASLSGYRELRQFGLHSERYRRARDRLQQIRTRMLNEDDPAEVRQQAAAAYKVMLEENLDWFGVLEFQDLQMVL